MQLRRSHADASRTLKTGCRLPLSRLPAQNRRALWRRRLYPAEAVAISGTPKEFTRDAASGGKVHSYFCPNCGSTVYWKADRLPSMIGVAVGALADPKYPPPIRSVFEQSKHDWVQIDGGVDHFRQGSGAKKSD